MYTLEIITDNNNLVVPLDDVKTHLRLNHDDEDDALTRYLRTATQMFEAWTGRSVLARTYRQHVHYFNSTVYLMKAPVREVVAVKYWDADNQLQTAADFHEDTISIPGSVWFDTYPVTSSTKRPKAFVEFEAGWDADKVPEDVKTAIMLLAGHYYEHREAFTDENLTALPMGFRAVCDQYKTGLMGPWSMGA
jgi:uncharacterized phiE125 gp8 family phage protein